MIDDKHSDVRFVFVGDSPFPFCHHFASISTNFDPSTLPRFLTLTTLSHSYHAFSIIPRFLTRTTLLSHTTLSHSYHASLSHHAFSLLPYFLTLATLSHFLTYSCHAFSLSLSPQIFSHRPSTTVFSSYHHFHLLPWFLSRLSFLTLFSCCHHLHLPPRFLTSGLSTCPVEVPKMNVLPKGNLLDPEETTTTTR